MIDETLIESWNIDRGEETLLVVRSVSGKIAPFILLPFLLENNIR